MDKEVALDFFAAIFGGRHHVPKLKECGYGWSITPLGHYSTYDGGLLTALVLLAHDRSIRVEISACNMQRVRIAIHQRTSVAEYTYDRHPTLEQAVEAWRKHHPAPASQQETRS